MQTLAANVRFPCLKKEVAERERDRESLEPATKLVKNNSQSLFLFLSFSVGDNTPPADGCLHGMAWHGMAWLHTVRGEGGGRAKRVFMGGGDFSGLPIIVEPPRQWWIDDLKNFCPCPPLIG